MIEKLVYLQDKFSEKKQKRYHIQVFIDLCKKLDDAESDLVKSKLEKAYELLNDLMIDDSLKPRSYLKAFSSLQKDVRKRFGYTAKNQLRNEAVGYGLAIGAALGIPFGIIQPGLSAIGVLFGLVFGAAFGDKLEKDAEAKGLTY